MATSKETTASARKPSSSSSPADDEKDSSWPLSWWIGGGVTGTITVLIFVYFIRNFCFSPEKAGPPSEKAEPPSEKAKVKPGMPCPSMQHDECMDNAACVKEEEGTRKGEVADIESAGLVAREEGAYYCKAFIGEKCVFDECLSPLDLDLEQEFTECSSTTKTCEVTPGMQDGAGISCQVGILVNDAVCKAEPGDSCASPRDTPMHWCKEGSKCERDGNGWTCKVKPGMPCPSMTHDECTDNAMCVKEIEDTEDDEVAAIESVGLVARKEEAYYCKAFIGEKCVFDECLSDRELGLYYPRAIRWGACKDTTRRKDATKTCEVTPWHEEKNGTKIDNSDFCKVGILQDGLCKGENGDSCASPRDTPMHWCKEGSKCERDGKGWTCKKTPPNGANIQLGEITDTRHVANQSRVMTSNNLRKKRTQTSGLLQVDLD